jgi:uncharacterized membrane protein YhaH (DUF805 family)
MHIQPSLLWTWNRSIDRVPYLVAGVVFFLVKFAMDWLIATQGFERTWSPLNYLIWPNDRVVRVLELGDPERSFSLTMLLVSLPFIWTGVILTLHRLRAAGLPLGLIVLFFVPLVNLLLFLILMVLPTRSANEPAAKPQSGTDDSFVGDETSQQTGITDVPLPPVRRRRFEPLRHVHRSIVLESYWRSGLVSLIITVPLAVSAVLLGGHVLQSYGFSLFVGAPFALGMISVLLFGFSRPKPFGACFLVAFLATTLTGAAIIVVALEGLICLIMAAPIAFFLSFLGGLVGYAIQSRPWLNDHAASVTFLMLLMVPSLMAAESSSEPEPALRAVHTEVIIDAPPAKVWPHVIAFPPLPEPDDWFFRTGVAYPQRAAIQGSGVGAVRHCVFSTGTFVEPIEVWDAPTLLQFRVTEQPEPMHEWSPYHIHPAHLDHYLCSHKGQFHLEELPDGRTRLIGTTWYSNRMWPAPYWNLWSDYIIHRIHGRVLTHIQELSEGPVP